MTNRTLSVKRRFPLLNAFGIAVEYFPHYVNLKPSLHSVDVVLLSFILKGRGRHYMEDKIFAETGSSLAVTHYGQRHDIVTSRRGMEVMNVYLDLQNHPLPILPQPLQPVLPLLLPLHPRFLHRLNRVVRLQFNDAQPLARLLFSILGEFQRRDPGYEEAVMLQWKLFLILCCRHALQNGFVPEATDAHASQRRLEELRRHLDQAYAEPHTLATLARRTRLSRAYLCRAFKAYTGKRLFDYLIERRIQAAMMALRSGDEKVLSIALDSGFHDLAYFNRKFKKIVGATPTQYRRTHFPAAIRKPMPSRAARP